MEGMKIAIAAAGVLLVLALLTALPEPRNDRDWEPALARAPHFAQLEDGRWRLHDLRAFSFTAAGAKSEAWRDVDLDPADLEEIWFFVEPLEGFDGAAHTLLSFVFGGATRQTIAISVEARRERGENYSGVSGLFNAYELIYLWSTEEDVLTRIAVGLDHDLYAYRLALSPEQARRILDHFITRTNELMGRPRFYNTLTSNCTNELAKAVNSAFPGALPWHYSHVLTGYAAPHLFDLGFIAKDGRPFAERKAASLARGAIQAAAGETGGDFSADWRAAIALQTP